jgi:hypothetical protein
MPDDLERPKARTTDLVVKPLGGELLIYDLTRRRAHSLNEVAAAVWRRCDGTRDAAGIAAALWGDERPREREGLVRYALGELRRARLLMGPGGEAGITRRDLLRQLGTGGAAALPLVTSIVAPTPADAQSCLPTGATCSSDAECCSRFCVPSPVPIFVAICADR